MAQSPRTSGGRAGLSRHDLIRAWAQGLGSQL